jgi:hypothetical protein
VASSGTLVMELALERREIELPRELHHQGARRRHARRRGGARCDRRADERDEEHAVARPGTPHPHALGARRAYARLRQESERETARGIGHHEARTLASGGIADERRDCADGERSGGLDEVRPASSMDHEHQLAVRGHRSHFECQRRERAGAFRRARRAGRARGAGGA